MNLFLDIQVYGNGKKHLLTFHGFGKHLDDFKYFAFLEKYYTIHGINLFHHGKSKYPRQRIKKNPLTKTEFTEYIRFYLNENNIDTIDILAYSMGGKFALTLVELMPEKVRNVYLLAPDGLSLNPWYVFAANTKAGNFFTKNYIKDASFLAGLTQAFYRFGVIPEKLKKFVLIQIESRSIRLLVYKVWLSFRKIRPNIKQVKKHSLQHNIKFIILLGKYDSVIKHKLGNKFIKDIENNCELFKLECGHNLFNEEATLLLKSSLEK
jgi:pimeloyl-ACP methyl ester carboxylesterase